MYSTRNFSAHPIMRGGPSLTVTLSVLLTLSGCSLFSRNRPEQEIAGPQAPISDGGMAAAEPPLTATEVAVNTPADQETVTVIPDAAPMLNGSAPKNYVVQRGDTLWGIANKFLKDPWLWPEIWYVNPAIENPHRIYPGDTVHLALSSDGRTELQLLRASSGAPSVRLEPLLRSTPLLSPIQTIPYSVISAFLARPGVLSRDEVTAAPYILALRDEHDIAGTGDEIYVKKLSATTGAEYSVMHVDEPLKDPDNGRRLGYLAIYTGTAQITTPGSVAKASLTDAARETLQGDVLIRDEGTNSSDLVPHPPARRVNGRIIAVVEGEELSGQYDVVALNRGAKDGLDRGTVLTADSVPAKTDDLCSRIGDRSTCLFHPSRVLPSEAAGTLLVFKIYENMSYALILNDSAPIHVYDRVRNP